MKIKLDDLKKSSNLILVLFLLLIGIVFCQCGAFKGDGNQSGEYSFIGSDGQLVLTYEQDAFKFKKDKNLLIINSSSIGTNQKGIFFDYKFQMDERCQDFIRKDSVKYNVTKVSAKAFNVNGKDHLLYKFYYDEYASWDEEDLIIVHQDLGVIFIHQYWGDRIELENHPKLSRAELITLKKLIQSDPTFYKTWNSCIWN